MSFQTYISGIPAAGDDPSVDQPQMLTNTNSIPVVLAIDHHAFNDNNGGFHKQVTFSEENIPGVAPIDPQSISFTALASSLTQVTAPQTTQAQQFYQNANGIFPVSALRIFSKFTFPNLQGNSYNISSAVLSNGNKTLTFNYVANSVSSNNYCPIITNTTGISITSVSLGATSIAITFSSAPSTGLLTICILQV